MLRVLFKPKVSVILIISFVVFGFCSSVHAQEQGAVKDESEPLLRGEFVTELEKAETFLYGGPLKGALLERINRLETDLFGRPLPGSIAERQKRIVDFLIKGVGDQPPMMFKLSVLEWALTQKVNMEAPVESRIADLEQLLEGKVQSGKPLATRLEKLISIVLPDDIGWDTQVPVPQNTLLKVVLITPLSSKTSRKGDIVKMHLLEDLIVDDILVAPKGSIVEGVVSDVKPPRTFGRSAELKVDFKYLLGLTYQKIPVFLGDEALSKTKSDKSLVAAAGASFLGLAVFGPIGLMGGFFIKGDAIKIPAGTCFYLQTKEDVTTVGYPIPESLLPSIKANKALSSDETEKKKEEGSSKEEKTK